MLPARYDLDAIAQFFLGRHLGQNTARGRVNRIGRRQARIHTGGNTESAADGDARLGPDDLGGFQGARPFQIVDQIAVR
ncbi:hypothetical protein DRQ50_09270 [bacterium]|nr:MAG: hypothetical protein DRQ50_09270 [bacterium]